MTNEEIRQIKLECLRLSSGHVQRATEMYNFVTGTVSLGGQHQQASALGYQAAYNHGAATQSGCAALGVLSAGNRD